MTKGPYYVSEADLYADVQHLYETNDFPKRLADNINKMSKRIVGAKRFDSCSDLLREDMISEAYIHTCLRLIERKFDFKRGSKVYSWVSRVIINKCLQLVLRDSKQAKAFQKFVEYTRDN